MGSIKQRSGYWDNVKAVLIFLVVLGHYFGSGVVYREFYGGQWHIPNAIYGFIYMFHMPLFAFVSGYFSKNVEKARNGAVSGLLIPYVLFNTICVLLNKLVLKVPLTNPIFEPYNHMWYLFALFAWRITAVDMQRLRHPWLWALSLACFCSVLTPGMDWTLVSRMILFWPFFLLGLNLQESHIATIKRIPKSLCVAALVTMFMAGLWILEKYNCSTYRLCFIARSFPHNIHGIPGLCKMLLRYVTAAVLGVCLLNIIPEKTGRLTTIGQYTMPVFLLHNLPGLRNVMVALNPFPENAVLHMLWYLLWAIMATLLFGNRFVAKSYQWLMKWITKLVFNQARL